MLHLTGSANEVQSEILCNNQFTMIYYSQTWGMV